MTTATLTKKKHLIGAHSFRGPVRYPQSREHGGVQAGTEPLGASDVARGRWCAQAEVHTETLG